MRILVFGPNGQVGQSIAREKPASIDLVPCDREVADLSQAGAARAAIESAKPDIIINASAFTAVDKAETERELCTQINAHAPGEMADAAAKAGARFIHISTDYVFDGQSGGTLNEAAPTNPLNHYGQSKLDGEAQVMEHNPRAMILRTSWVYSPFGGNFVKTMLRLAETRDELTIVGDQIGGPTPARDIAKACLHIAQHPNHGPDHSGVFHFQGGPATSWAGFARAIFEAAGLATRVIEIPTTDYPTPATRPLRTVLDCARIGKAFGLDQPDWRASLGGIINEIRAAK